MASTEVGDNAVRNDADFIDEQGNTGRAARPGDRAGDRPEANAAADHLWHIADVAQYLRLPVNSIYKMTARKAAVHIPHIRIGASLRFRRSDIDRWLTLLTSSNIEALNRMRQKATKASHGRDSQTSP